ncbi:DUF3102 domain-containing protein [Desulfosporosinus meridiei]|uniref:DUF3102 domain-containing protein n=1 Tax=Desulfosporosinus meridiei TaxID=79209 RepID=UPI0002314FAA|nr:DUF3102 domain-containing protein [Desulfosporosinus meridiei]
MKNYIYLLASSCCPKIGNVSDFGAVHLNMVCHTYGTQQAASLAVGGQGEGLPNLSYSQALTLLVVPEEDRAQFIAELDVESMSIRELQKAVKERNQALQERDQAILERGDIQKALNNQVSKISQLTTERDNLKSKPEELSKSKGEIETRAGKLQSELNSIKKSTEYTSIQ